MSKLATLPSDVLQSRRFVWRAWMVHLYTGLGLIMALGALNAIVVGDLKRIFLFLGLALWIDATDGPLARTWEVKHWVPNFDGRKLDDITDYITYTFLPVYFAFRFGLVEGYSTVVLGLILMASAYGFCHEAAKTEDNYFTGFPSYWNLVIVYLYLLGTPPWVNATVLFVFFVLIWVPVKYITLHTRVLRKLTLALFFPWVILLSAALIQLVAQGAADPLLVRLSLYYPAYHIGLSFYLHLTGKSR